MKRRRSLSVLGSACVLLVAGCSAGTAPSSVATTTTTAPTTNPTPAGPIVLTCSGTQSYTGTVITPAQQRSSINIAAIFGAPAGATLRTAAVPPGYCSLSGTYRTGLAIDGQIVDGAIEPGTGAFSGEVQTVLSNGCTARKLYTGTLTDTLVEWVPGADINNCAGSSPLTFSVAATAPPRTTEPTTTPSITSVTPASIPVGIGNTSIDVVGVNFDATSVVKWNTTALVTTLLEPGHLRPQVPAALVASPGTASITVVNGSGAPSNASTVTVTANPVISSVSPANIQVGIGNTSIDVTGLNFDATSVVRWNTTALVTTLLEPGHLRPQVPAALVASPGTASITVVNGGGQPSNASTITITANPVINSVSPGSISVGLGNTSIDVTGLNFDASTVVRWNTTALVTTLFDANHVRGQVPAALVATPGGATITVANGSGPQSNSASVSITAAPVITSVSPGTIPLGAGTTTIDVNGLNFNATSVVRWNATSLATTLVDANRVRGQVPAALLSTSGGASITVANGGGSPSNAGSVNVTAAPVVNGVTPGNIPVGIGNTSIDVTGLNFDSTSVARWNGTALTTTLFDSGHVRGQVPAALVSVQGGASITVANGSGLVSNAGSVNVTGNPVINQITPSTITAGIGNTSIDIDGINFNSSSVVKWNGTSLATTLFDSTHVRGQIPAALVASPGSASITVVNSSGSPSNAGSVTVK